MAQDRPTPKHAGEWENLGVSLVDLPEEVRLRASSEATSKDVHRIHLLISFAAVAALLLLLDSIGTFSPEPKPVQAYEIDLSRAAWRVQLGEEPELDLAAPDLDDSGWCPVSVPDPRRELPEEVAVARPEHCPPRHQLAAAMRNTVVWYRCTVCIDGDKGWQEPALFLGSVRSRGRVYWDGDYVGSVRREREPVTVELEYGQVAPGTHLLAVRVECGTEERPGIDHSYARGVALGEYRNCLPQAERRQRQLAVGVLAALIQAVAFVLLALLAIETRGARTELFWLSLFFGSVLLYAIQGLTVDPLAWYLRSLAIASASTSVLGFGLEHSLWSGPLRRALHRTFALVWAVVILVFTVVFFVWSPGETLLMGGRTGAAFLPLLALALSLVWLIRGISLPKSKLRTGQPWQALLLVLTLYGFLLARFFSLVQELPLLRSPFMLPLLSCLVFYYVVLAYTDELRSLAFYGRFIRPGLKRLLQQKGRTIFGDEKLFRGRKTVIMKLDTVDHTKTTFGMPYGMRRLFLDLWYTLIDLVVADKVFLDKSLGDGSVYCFDGALPGGSCTAALRSAIEIRDHQVARFDETFCQRLRQVLEQIPELRPPAEVFLRDYRQRIGREFWDRRTRVRIALVSGYVDEGLWGLSSQSHYDVQGCPLVLATRMEAEAGTGEIIFDRAFLDELEEESPGLLDHSRLERRERFLKGIGTWEVYAMPEGVTLEPTSESQAERALPDDQ